MKRLLSLETRIAEFTSIPSSSIAAQIGTQNTQLMFRGTNYNNQVVEIWRDLDNNKLYVFTAEISDENGVKTVGEPVLAEETGSADSETARQIRDERGPYIN